MSKLSPPFEPSTSLSSVRQIRRRWRQTLSIELEVVERLMEAVRLAQGNVAQIKAAIDHLSEVVARLPERNRGYYAMQIDDLKFQKLSSPHE